MNDNNIIIGIDPGLTGAIAIMDPSYKRGMNEGIEVFDMPTMPMEGAQGKPKKINASGKGDGYAKGKKVGKRQVDAETLAMTLGFIPPQIRGAVYVENVHSMPGQGVASMFNFGHGVGIVHGVLAALGFEMVLVEPVTWKKFHGLIGSEKDAARVKAIADFPPLAPQLKRKKDIGRADALLIAGYGVSLG